MFANLALPVFGHFGEAVGAGCDKRDKAAGVTIDDGVGCLHRAFHFLWLPHFFTIEGTCWVQLEGFCEVLNGELWAGRFLN